MFQTCEFIKQYLLLNKDQMVKDFLFSIIVNNYDK